MLKTPWSLLIAGLVLYGLTAWFSAGYHHPDEHFQLLEPANYRLGGTPAADLAWEFRDRIRPGLQPWVAYVAIGGLRSVGVDSPFAQAFGLRLMSGWLAWLVFWAWARRWTPDRAATVLLWPLLVLWFMPYLSVRFSSENWGGLALCSGLLLITQFIDNEIFREKWRLLAGGFLLGLSFVFRFQMAFALLGLGGWLLYYGKLRPGAWVWLFLGGTLALALGAWADFWLYGEWVPTAFNYFRANILEHKAANWGTAPWWFYFQEMVLTGLPPVSVLLLISAVWGGWKYRQHAFVWILPAFLAAHILVAHKELRFLFPMVFPCVALAALAWPEVRVRFGQATWAKALFGLAVAVNLLVLPVRCMLPANEAVPCLQFLYEYARRHPSATVVAIEKSPYNLVGLNARFYRPEGLDVQVLPSLAQVDSLPERAGRLLIYPRLRLPQTLTHYQAERRYSYFPDWIQAVNVNDWQSRSRIWSIYEVTSR